jgi:hypothetical protein
MVQHLVMNSTPTMVWSRVPILSVWHMLILAIVAVARPCCKVVADCGRVPTAPTASTATLKAPTATVGGPTVTLEASSVTMEVVTGTWSPPTTCTATTVATTLAKRAVVSARWGGVCRVECEFTQSECPARI